MRQTWESRIQRAEHLRSDRPQFHEILSFYQTLLNAQAEIYRFLRTRRGWLPSGAIESDLSVLLDAIPGLLKAVKKAAPETLALEAESLMRANSSEWVELLSDYWASRSDRQFFAKAVFQPYACWAREAGVSLATNRMVEASECRCPFCYGKPQVAALTIKETSSESGNRDLVCSTCLLTWPFRRVVCANCLEENPAKIGYYHAPEFEYVRVEACDSCRYYIKSVDLTKYGFADPLVDEVASAPLDLWARDHDYTKIEMNLIGV